MKKILILFAMVLLLLCGCTEEPAVTTAPDVPETTVPVTEAPGLYEPGTELEILTDGAIRGYPLHDNTCCGVAPMGDDLLIFCGEEVTTLTLLTGENLSTAASVTLDCFLYPENPGVQIWEDGIAFYDSTDHAVVFLNRALEEVSRIVLPEDVEDSPVLSPDRSTVYYCAGNQIRALDLQSGISRLVKEQVCSWQYLTGIFCDGDVLCCITLDDDGFSSTLYISTQTGETLFHDGNGISVDQLQTWGRSYFAYLNFGTVRQLVYSLDGGENLTLEPPDGDFMTVPVLACGGVVTVNVCGTGCALDYYDLASGTRTASVELPEMDAVSNLVADPSENVLWFVYYDWDDQLQTLYAWDPAKSAVSDTTVYTGKYYTAENPDTEGLALCQQEALRIGGQYGVEILLGQDALAIEPWDYTYVPEYLVSVYRRGLQWLEAALSRFPDGFFAETASQSDCGTLRIALVRDIRGDAAYGTLDSAVGVQYWYDGDTCIGLALTDTLEQTFYHELCHAIEPRVYAGSTAYDDWDSLNPKGFRYDYDYITNQERTDYQYLEGSDRAFIDMYSMSFPTEDRARIFEYAMIDVGADYFSSETMQRKLNKLCVGIRKAYGLKNYPQVLPWEQYLNEPLTP